MCSITCLAIRLALAFPLFINFFHPTIAPPPIEMLSSAHDAGTGLYDAHDVKTTEVITEGHSPICQRSLVGCFGGLRSSSGVETSPISQARETVGRSSETERLSSLRNRISSFRESLHEAQASMVWKFRAGRDHWNMAQASYEIRLAKEARRVKDWNENGKLAEKLSEVSLARKRSTIEYGGFNPQIEEHITEIQLPLLHREFNEAMKNEIKSMLTNEESAVITQEKVAILNKIYEAERQDLRYGGMIQWIKPELDQLNQKFSSIQAIRHGFEHLSPPPHPNLITLIQSTSRRAVPRRSHYEWMAYQFKAEVDQYAYLRSLGPDLQATSRAWVEIHKVSQRLLKNLIAQAAWRDGTIYPEKFDLHDFKLLGRIEHSRRSLNHGQAIAARGESWLSLPDGASRQEVELESEENEFLSELALQDLMIQSISEPYSQDALQHLQDLVKVESVGQRAQRYLETATKYQHQFNTSPPRGFQEIRSLRPLKALPVRLGSPPPSPRPYHGDEPTIEELGWDPDAITEAQTWWKSIQNDHFVRPHTGDISLQLYEHQTPTLREEVHPVLSREPSQGQSDLRSNLERLHTGQGEPLTEVEQNALSPRSK